MPIVDIEIVGDASVVPQALAQALADQAGRVFGLPPGTTWVRVRALDAAGYAENETGVAAQDRPVFVTVTTRQAPAALAEEIGALSRAVAQVVGRPVERVHVIYGPAAAGRIAFGGVLAQ